MNVKLCEMKMDKLKGVQRVGPLSGHSEPCLKSIGHMTKELLKFECKKKFVLCLRSLNNSTRNTKCCSHFHVYQLWKENECPNLENKTYALLCTIFPIS